MWWWCLSWEAGLQPPCRGGDTGAMGAALRTGVLSSKASSPGGGSQWQPLCCRALALTHSSCATHGTALYNGGQDDVVSGVTSGTAILNLWIPRVPLRHSGLRIWRGHCSSSSGCYGVFDLWPGIFHRPQVQTPPRPPPTAKKKKISDSRRVASQVEAEFLGANDCIRVLGPVGAFGMLEPCCSF